MKEIQAISSRSLFFFFLDSHVKFSRDLGPLTLSPKNPRRIKALMDVHRSGLQSMGHGNTKILVGLCPIQISRETSLQNQRYSPNINPMVRWGWRQMCSHFFPLLIENPSRQGKDSNGPLCNRDKAQLVMLRTCNLTNTFYCF
jgi:hypothetical protein